jgi:hypothetical protein
MSRKKPSPPPKKKDNVISEPNKIVPFRDKIKIKMAAMHDCFRSEKRGLLKENSFIEETKTFFYLYWKKLGGDFLNNVKKFLFFTWSWFWRISVFLLGLSDEGAAFWERTPWILRVFQSFFSTIVAVSILICFAVYGPEFIKNCREFSFSSFFTYDLEKEILNHGLISRGLRQFCRMWDWTFINLSRLAMNALYVFLYVIFNFEAKIADPSVKKIDYHELWNVYVHLLREAGIHILKKKEDKKEEKSEDKKEEKSEDKRKKE